MNREKYEYKYKTDEDLLKEFRTYRFFKRLRVEYKKHGWYMDKKTLIKMAWGKSKKRNEPL